VVGHVVDGIGDERDRSAPILRQQELKLFQGGCSRCPDLLSAFVDPRGSFDLDVKRDPVRSERGDEIRVSWRD
jgi:hypothetical protein